MKIATCIALCAFLIPGMPQNTDKAVYSPYKSPEVAKQALYRQELEESRLQQEALRIEQIKSEPVSYLQYAGEQHGLAQWEINKLDAVMWCESKYCAHSDNPESSASGCFQIVYGTWNAYSEWPWADRYDHVKNIDTALNLYQQSGIHHWQQCL